MAARSTEKMSLAAARRVALAAQGFAEPRPPGKVDRRHLRRLFERVGVVQIDSVNVVARSHELPLFARLGPHPRNWLVAETHAGELFEYWGHEASFLPVALQPLFRHRMEAARQGAAWNGLVRFAREKPALVEAVWEEVAQRGPLAAGELSIGGEGRKGPWWGWNDAKLAVEYLFWCGRLSARRRPNFEREYATPEAILPAAVLAVPTPPEDEAQRELLTIAARCLGVATASDLADYFRLNVPRARPRIAELVEAGVIVPTRVEGWKDTAYLWPAARQPRKVEACALVSPFDSLVWERDRAERLFDFRYRLEFYTPAPKRQFGYYVMPFVLGEAIVARVDLKADRAAGVLRAHAAYPEAHADPAQVAEPLAAELRTLSQWLGLGDVDVGQRGDLAPALAAALQR